MDIARNHITPETGDAQGRAREGLADLQLPADLHHIDWQALRSRLFATREMAGTLGADAAASRLHLRGSFDGCAASMLTTYQASLTSINHGGSSNRKPEDGTNDTVADVDGNGERG